MTSLDRAVDAAARRRHDLIIIGGGIHGAAMLLEAARRGLEPLLIEKDDFGGATSASSLKILHGGLRYLQSLDLRRVFESVADRRWYCRNFPELVRPLPCLMPLYQRGLRRRSVMRAALVLNDLLSWHRNRGVPERARVPGSTVLTNEELVRLFPGVDRDGLHGGALWHDAVMTRSERLTIEVLRWASAVGGTALNYVEALDLESAPDGGLVLSALDREAGSRLTFRTPIVINCAGPWAGELAKRLDGTGGEPDPIPWALAFNVLLEREPPSTAAVAVEPRDGGRTYFLVPWNGRTLAGTYQAAWVGPPGRPLPDSAAVDAMLDDLNRAVPGLGARPGHVLRVFPGLIPACGPGEAEGASDDVFVDHGRRGGTQGMYTVIGVKYTTAHAVAERTLRRIYGSRPLRPGTARPVGHPVAGAGAGPDWTRIVAEEAVLHLDDLLLRRMEWDPARPAPEEAVEALARTRGWGREARRREQDRLRTALAQRGTTAPTTGSPER